ncbi:conserved hypothetical protein [Alkaliphilus metalliredigens QYMF]|uniref:Uncharacterized protein n=1 Tax=Alkaliphilus metalliredigens (strain QYMF) TaxID=293826 RepID=A6TPU4_ALKMQ|nr:RlmF-related methyltransferase [Alkaliphilus metalliredigens]ABR48212.1 conserved hypothetical protein [Alkaliphilus metalliredigens QYMF]
MVNENVNSLLGKLDDFIDRFTKINSDHYRGLHSANAAEMALEEYTEFILDVNHRQTWDEFIDLEMSEIKDRIANIRRESAHCVWTMEKYRAMTLISENDMHADYFKNIESCIEEELGKFVVDKDSRILLIGVGAFPMTPLLIAKKTGAKVVGIDIDEEAVEYAKKVINILGKGLDTEVNSQGYAELTFTKEATHIIIASTIPEKVDILQDLYTLTNEDVVVSMRYGNGFKSLFNYPLTDTLKGTWNKVENIYFDNNVFDVAMLKK